MPLVTRNPTSNTTPDPGQGGNAVTGNSNTGHASTTSFATRNTNGTTSQSKTCIWTTLQAVSGLIKSINLKFTWSASGSVVANTTAVGDSADAFAQFVIGYSLNGGGAWTNQVVRTAVASAIDGASDSDGFGEGPVNETVSIPVTTDITQIRVRDSITAEATVSEVSAADATASTTAEISNIRLEITLADGSVMCGM